MTGMIDHIYRSASRPLSERWLGGLHAGLVIKGLYLQWKVAAYLRQGERCVLDAGCGPDAQLSAMLAGRYPTCSFVGWDLHVNPDIKRILRQPNVSVIESDITQLADSCQYDLVYSIDVLEHIEDFDGTLDRLVGSLRPGGLLFIHVPSLDHRLWFGAEEREMPHQFRAHRSGDDHVHEGFSLSQLRQALQQRSMEVLDARPTFGRWVSLAKELFSRGERHGLKGVGLLLLPAVLIGVLMETIVPPSRGNGSMILGRKLKGAKA